MKNIEIRVTDAHYKMLEGLARARNIEILELIEETVIEHLKESYAENYDMMLAAYRKG